MLPPALQLFIRMGPRRIRRPSHPLNGPIQVLCSRTRLRRPVEGHAYGPLQLLQAQSGQHIPSVSWMAKGSSSCQIPASVHALRQSHACREPAKRHRLRSTPLCRGAHRMRWCYRPLCLLRIATMSARLDVEPVIARTAVRLIGAKQGGRGRH